MSRWTVEPKARDAKGRIRWYRLRWNGPRLNYCRDGHTMGAYRRKRDADTRAAELTATNTATGRED